MQAHHATLYCTKMVLAMAAMSGTAMSECFLLCADQARWSQQRIGKMPEAISIVLVPTHAECKLLDAVLAWLIMSSATSGDGNSQAV